MLGNWITAEQRFIFINDQLHQERIARKVIGELLRDDSIEPDSIIQQPVASARGDRSGYDDVLAKCAQKATDHKWNIVLPTLGEMLMGETPSFVFRYIQRLLTCDNVQHVVLWASESTLLGSDSTFIMKCCQHMAHTVIAMDRADTLSVFVRRRFGKAASKTFQCVRSETKFEVLVAKANAENGDDVDAARVTGPVEDQAKVGGVTDGTFKIDLEEDEVVARNALKLPYERTAEPEVAKVLYTPDTNDDMDDSEPEEEDT